MRYGAASSASSGRIAAPVVQNAQRPIVLSPVGSPEAGRAACTECLSFAPLLTRPALHLTGAEPVISVTAQCRAAAANGGYSRRTTSRWMSNQYRFIRVRVQTGSV
jgi:hypothetical protein